MHLRNLAETFLRWMRHYRADTKPLSIFIFWARYRNYSWDIPPLQLCLWMFRTYSHFTTFRSSHCFRRHVPRTTSITMQLSTVHRHHKFSNVVIALIRDGGWTLVKSHPYLVCIRYYSWARTTFKHIKDLNVRRLNLLHIGIRGLPCAHSISHV